MSYNKQRGKKRQRKVQRANPDSFLWCFCNVIKAVFTLLNWVPHFVARHTHRVFVGFFNVSEAHYKLTLRIIFGVTLLFASYLMEGLIRHQMWPFIVDSVRCAAVCPIVDGCYDVLKIADDMV